jgi:predicted phosphate transport protein (TIGR00153 family)
VWLGRQKERKVLELCKEHLDRVVKTVTGMRKTVYAFCDLDASKVNGAFKEVFKDEREADELKREILDELSKGIFHPINREEIIRLILTAEDVADNAKAASRKLNLIPPKKISMHLRSKLKEFSDNLLKIANLTGDVFKALIKKPSETLARAQAVEEMEEKIDDFLAEVMLPAVLVFCNRLRNVWIPLMLMETIENMENVADRCEDVADIMRWIAISSA